MKLSEDKIVAGLAKAALLENELAEAFRAEEQMRVSSQEPAFDKGLKLTLVAEGILILVLAGWIVYQQSRYKTLEASSNAEALFLEKNIAEQRQQVLMLGNSFKWFSNSLIWLNNDVMPPSGMEPVLGLG